ncbi:hypothetical protein Prudu_015258 [Prunus dulcis]|uniref:Uncharacterized protein n=1 Tax=Prunus dulcis TaxID=3755 RepID=A0A4Y1RJ06_PRUDU|nr:hypothetical protein Prudu_015258 [Prunus dulcis]
MENTTRRRSKTDLSKNPNQRTQRETERGKMLDPRNDLLPPPSSPTNSSISSSDLDTESTGSFFHDRSTTLGTLMGVSFPAITFRAPSQQRRDPQANSNNNNNNNNNMASTSGSGSRKTKKPKKKNAAASSAVGVVAERRRRWWRLCRDDCTKPASLASFLRWRGDSETMRFITRLRSLKGSWWRSPEMDGYCLPMGGCFHRPMLMTGLPLHPRLGFSQDSGFDHCHL